jgi:hypothetical protein
MLEEVRSAFIGETPEAEREFPENDQLPFCCCFFDTILYNGGLH